MDETEEDNKSYKELKTTLHLQTQPAHTINKLKTLLIFQKEF